MTTEAAAQPTIAGASSGETAEAAFVRPTGNAQEREILAKVRTWPWATGTFRWFMSAILLPPGLFLVQPGLGRTP